ncbi:DUF2726 domain-containing protein [Acinetobacter sp. WZC-1]|uniref:DUF2726 domain-containing protein n=1 Tax=Acinetobacter sp. WZC-1 TaxID=3459034 RepID=UPI00403E200B
MNMIIAASLLVFALVIVAAYKGLKTKQQSDSVLRQRAVFNANEQKTFTRLKDILPNANVLAHVSFDALLTTKYLRTRRKYQQMFADFVVLDQACRVVAIVALDDLNPIKRAAHGESYQDAVLRFAGYRVIRYSGVPEYQQLREDFRSELPEMQDTDHDIAELPGQLGEYRHRTSAMRAFG